MSANVAWRTASSCVAHEDTLNILKFLLANCHICHCHVSVHINYISPWEKKHFVPHVVRNSNFYFVDKRRKKDQIHWPGFVMFCMVVQHECTVLAIMVNYVCWSFWRTKRETTKELSTHSGTGNQCRTQNSQWVVNTWLWTSLLSAFMWCLNVHRVTQGRVKHECSPRSHLY